MNGRPFVVCICPTRGRLDFVRQAIRYFVRQTYPHRELLILADDYDEGKSIRSMVEDGQIVTMTVEKKLPIGQKRNILCERARIGSVICHWDDDDWYSPNRIAEQVAVIEAGADMTASNTMLFADDANRKVWRFTGDRLRPIGVSFMYRRSVWEDGRFEHKSISEDNDFSLLHRKHVVIANYNSMVARIHSANTSPKVTEMKDSWTEEPWEAALALGYEPIRERVAA